MNRRNFLRAGTAAIAGAAMPASALRLDEGAKLFNPCEKLGGALRNHEFTLAGFENLDAGDVWDCHVHLLGLGESGSGAWITPKMQTAWHLRLYAQYRFYLNAACVDPALKNVDRDYFVRLRTLMADFPAGYRAMVMAFDRTHDEAGRPQLDRSAFYLPNAYAQDIAAKNASRIAWVASIHPIAMMRQMLSPTW